MSNEYFKEYPELEAVNNFIKELCKMMEAGRDLIHEVTTVRISMQFRETYHELLRNIENIEIKEFEGKPLQSKFKVADKKLLSEALTMIDQALWRIDHETMANARTKITRDEIEKLKDEFNKFPDNYFD